MSVLLNDGAGTFLAATNYPTSGNPSAIALGDLNGDGKADLAIANGTASQVVILLNRGDGVFPSSSFVQFSSGAAFAAAIGDVNGDGKPDLVASDPVTVFLGHGDGTFAAGPEIDVGACCCNESIAIADFDGDGQLDLAAVSGGGTNLMVALNRTIARTCAVANDCESFVCVEGKCVSSCQDAKLDDDETDVDCGGPACVACDEGLTCKVPGDCASGGCSAGRCDRPTCP